MTSSRSVVLAAPVCTAIDTFGSSLKEVSAPDLGAIAIGAAVDRVGLEPDEIGTEGAPSHMAIRLEPWTPCSRRNLSTQCARTA